MSKQPEAFSAPTIARGADDFADVVAEITDKLQGGAAVNLQDYLDQHPDWAERLRDLLPALEVMAELGRSAAEADGADADRLSPNHKPHDTEELAGTLGDFRIVRELGRGGMGIVYEAEQISLARRVALKVLPLASTMDPRHLQRFHNEARAAACLHHTNIVPVFAVGCERGVHFYAMQLIEGQTIAAVIRAQRTVERKDVAPPSADLATTAQAPAPSAVTKPVATLSSGKSGRDAAYFRTVAELGAQAAEALDFAHKVGVVHRDIKPANLMLDGRGIVWITDFGLAMLQTDSGPTLTGDLVGTLRYMSPEQALAKRVLVDQRTDVYSLGATLYELLTLEPVFAGSDRQELLRQIAFEEPKPPRRINHAIPAELETIVLKAMEKNPAERYTTAQDLADDLRRFLEDQPIRARRATLAKRVRKWARRHKAEVAAAVICLVFALVAGVASAAWVLGEQSARHGEAEAKVLEALKVVDTGLRQGNPWDPTLIAAVERVKSQLGNLGGNPGLRQQVQEMLRDLVMVRELEEARLHLTAGKLGDFDYEGANAAYRAAFGKYELDVEVLEPQSAADQVRAQAIHRQLVAALDDWAFIRKLFKGIGWRQLLGVARAADPDPLRQRLRDAMEGKDSKAFEDLAGVNQAEDWPVQTLVLLGRLVPDTASRARVIALLGRAQQRHPNDYWINETLGYLLHHSRHRRLEEAIRFYTVAVALRPANASARLDLANALQENGKLDEAIAQYREVFRLRKDYDDGHNNLGAALHKKGLLDEAIAEYRVALRLNKNNPEAHNNFGVALKAKGHIDEAIAEYREAIRLKKDYPSAHHNLGNAILRIKGKLDEAIAECREAIRLRKDFAEAHHSLGIALHRKGLLDEAIAEYREALRLKKDDPDAHSNLGSALKEKGELDNAIAEFREAIQLNKNHPNARFLLGNALGNKGLVDKAIVQYREHLQRMKNDPKAENYPEAHNNLGNALSKMGQLEEAIAEFREALRLKNYFPAAHHNLGAVLIKKGQLEEAIAELREVLRLEKDNSEARYNLAIAHYDFGNTLQEKGRHTEAITAFREAIRLKEDFAEAHCNLGQILLQQGQFQEGLKERRRGHELGSRRPGWSYPSAQWVRMAEYLVDLEARLPALLNGMVKPKDIGETLTLAQVCRLKKFYGGETHWYKEAFTAQPALTANGLHRYNAACAAALAGCGEGNDAAKLDEKEKRRLRDQALAWLRTDLELLNKQHRAGHLPGVILLEERVGHAQEDADFKGVRDSLAVLPEAEQAAWRKHWTDTYQLLKKVRGDLIQTTLQGTLTNKTHQQSHDQLLEAGKEYVIDMTSRAFDTFLKLLDPKGNLVAENDDIAPNNLNSRVIYTPKETGTFRIVATSFQERGRGAYAVTITTLKGKPDKKSP